MYRDHDRRNSRSPDADASMVTNKKDPIQGLQAERVGFEPTIPFGIRALQARALGRTMQPLQS